MELFGTHSFDDITVHNGNRKQNVDKMITTNTIANKWFEISSKVGKYTKFKRKSEEIVSIIPNDSSGKLACKLGQL